MGAVVPIHPHQVMTIDILSPPYTKLYYSNTTHLNIDVIIFKKLIIKPKGGEGSYLKI